MTPGPPVRTRLTKAPPTRYRVVERGRRLEVIDTLAGERATNAMPNPPVAPLPSGVERTRFDGSGTLTTHPLYDAKAPRTIRLGSGAATAVGRAKLIAIVAIFAFVLLAVWQPALLVVLVALAQKGVRDGLRGAVTRWLDGVERDAS